MNYYVAVRIELGHVNAQQAEICMSKDAVPDWANIIQECGSFPDAQNELAYYLGEPMPHPHPEVIPAPGVRVW